MEKKYSGFYKFIIENDPSLYANTAARGWIPYIYAELGISIIKRPKKLAPTHTYAEYLEIFKTIVLIKNRRKMAESIKLNFPKMYDELKKNKWIQKILDDLIPVWNFQSCLAEAKLFSSRQEWQEKSMSSYSYAMRTKIYDKISNEVFGNRNSWTFDQCLNEAKKYNSITEWKKNHYSSFGTARYNKWYDDIKKIVFPLIKKRSNNKLAEEMYKMRLKNYSVEDIAKHFDVKYTTAAGIMQRYYKKLGIENLYKNSKKIFAKEEVLKLFAQGYNIKQLQIKFNTSSRRIRTILVNEGVYKSVPKTIHSKEKTLDIAKTWVEGNGNGNFDTTYPYHYRHACETGYLDDLNKILNPYRILQKNIKWGDLCKNGHKRIDNTYIDKNGNRSCLMCRRNKNIERRKKSANNVPITA